MNKTMIYCPFCNGEDVEIVQDGHGWNVGCLPCDYKIHAADCTKEEAIRYWNTRPAEDALKAENERVKNKLALVKKHIVDNRDALLFVLKSEHDRATYCEFAFCQSLIELINTDTGKGGEDE